MIIILFVKITLILLFISNLFCWRKKTKLLCGLWCYVGNEPADGMKMRILALYNMSRGDHATGICIDDEITKETIDSAKFLAKYPEFFEFQTLSKKNFTVLGHCRAATIMYSKEKVEFAHPHGIKKSEDDKRPFLLLEHNGTVSNVSDLCSKYDIDHNYSKYSDSMQLGRIITKCWKDKNMEVLREYEGSATLAFYPITAKNTLYIHKDRMRDLFYWQESENKTYISSIKDSLLAIGAKEDEVVEFPDGILFQFKDGAIAKQWDFSKKHPYSKPRVYASPARATHTPDFTTVRGRGKDGFYWENHRIYHNGHLYIGDCYLEKDGRKIEKEYPNGEREKYIKLYILMGIVMKDEASYRKLFHKCVKGGNFDIDKFKKIPNSELGNHSMYPVLGKTFAGGQDIFWFEGLGELSELDTYKWRPPLAKQEFEIPKSGILTGTVTISACEEMTSKEAIKHLIKQKVELSEIYQNPVELFDAYVKSRNIQVRSDTYNGFLDDLLDVLRMFNHVSRADLSFLERERYTEDYSDGQTLQHEFNTVLANSLSFTCTREITMRVEEQIDIEETVTDENFSEDSAYFKSPGFKNKFLFEAYDSIDDALANYVQSDEEIYVKDFLLGINELLHDVGRIDDSEHEENKKAHVDVLKTRVRMAYNYLTTEAFFRAILEGFEGKEIDIYVAINQLYDNILVLRATENRTADEESKYSIYKLALKHILLKGTFLNTTKLKKMFNITSQQLTEVCQS